MEIGVQSMHGRIKMQLLNNRPHDIFSWDVTFDLMQVGAPGKISKLESLPFLPAYTKNPWPRIHMLKLREAGKKNSGKQMAAVTTSKFPVGGSHI